MYIQIPDPVKEEMVNAAINIQAIVNLLASKGIILSEQEWENARYQASIQLQGKYGYLAPPPPPLPTPPIPR